MKHDKDEGYTVERCKSGLSASETLSVGSNLYEERIRYWRKQLAFAEAREAQKESRRR